MNQVRATGIPKYLRNAPSIMESGGISPNRMMINSVITNHVICVKVTGKGKTNCFVCRYELIKFLVYDIATSFNVLCVLLFSFVAST